MKRPLGLLSISWCGLSCLFTSLKLCFFFSALRNGLTANAQTTSSGILPLPLIPQSSRLDSIPTDVMEWFDFSDEPAPITPFDNLSQTVIMEVGGVDSEFSFAFTPEDGKNFSDYYVEVECSNHDVLISQDVTLGPPVLMQGGRTNYTVDVAFEKDVGKVDVSIYFRRQDRTEYASITLQYIVCGISFYYYHAETGKTQHLKANELLISSFHELVRNPFLSFYCFIQFPDGSSSETPTSTDSIPSPLTEIDVSVEGDQLISGHNFETCLTGHSQQLSNGTIVLDNSCSFGFTSLKHKQPLLFNIRLLKYRTGQIKFNFRWHGFLREEVLNEIYETTLTVRVAGSVPVSITAMDPPGPFRKTGGQLIECVVINSSPDQTFYLTIGNHSLAVNSRRILPGGSNILSFITPAGEGANVPWDLSYAPEGTFEQISCLWSGESQRFVFNYLTQDIKITSLSPSHGPIEGGTVVTCKGYFGNFNLSSGSSDVIILGTYTLESEQIVSVTSTTLVFNVPSMQVTQSAQYEIECFIIVHGIRSNVMLFRYESLSSVHIEITGGSFEEENNVFMVPVCKSENTGSENQAVTLFANVNHGASLVHLQFQWHIAVVSTKTEVFTAAGTSELQSVTISMSKLSVHETYEVVVTASDLRFKTQEKSSIQIAPTTLKRIGVGLSLDHLRTISLPPVDARITASVTDLSTCHGTNKSLSYEWTFMSSITTMTPDSDSVETSIPSPRRLGREFIVPRTKLSYGKHIIKVRVYYADDPSVFGTATTLLSVNPAPLQPVIGSGEAFIQVSAAEDLVMRGSKSHDPDMISSEVTEDLSYLWECELSTVGGRKFASVTKCPNIFLPHPDKEHFTISSKVLSSFQITNQTTYLRYFLAVRKKYKHVGIRTSPRQKQVVEIVRTSKIFAERGPITVAGYDGRPLPHGSIPYYDGVIIDIRGNPGNSWRFRLLEPAVNSSTLLHNPNNLLALPGFYEANSFLAKRHSLGIRRGVLQPSTDYKFEIQFESRNAERTTSVELVLRTMRRAMVTFLPMTRTRGTAETIFSAIASPSFQHHDFKFYFIMKLENGTELCIDGCSGQRRVFFRIPITGNHSVRCRMVDARGKLIIHEATDVQHIVISEQMNHTNSLSMFATALNESYFLGDHSAFAMESMKLANFATHVRSNNTELSEMAADLFAITVERLSKLYKKSQPSTALAKDYTEITKLFTSVPVGSELLSNINAFYDLCKMLYFAVHNTPKEERFDMVHVLRSALGQLAAHARQIHQDGSSRRRLVVSRAVRASDVNEELLALNEQVVPLMLQVMGRSEPCGHSSVANVPNVGVVHVFVGCNREQASKIRGKYAQLEWCDDVYDQNRGGKVMFALGELDDYIRESNVLSLRRGIDRSEKDKDKAAVVETKNMPSQGYVITKAKVLDGAGGGEPADGIDGKCFLVVQKARASSIVLGPDVECSSVGAIEYRNMKGLNDEMHHDAYQEQLLDSTAMVSRDNRESNRKEIWVGAGLHRVDGKTFGLKRFSCRDLRPFIVGEIHGRWIAPVVVMTALVLVVLLSILGVYKIVGGRPVWIDGDEGPYIERDVHGRDTGVFEATRLDADDKGDGNGGNDDEVLFENATPRLVAGKVNDGRPVRSLFAD